MLSFALVSACALEQGAADIVIRQGAAAVLWWLIALAVAFGLFPRQWPPRTVVAVVSGLVLLGLWTALSLTWTTSSERTLAETARVGAHLSVVVIVAFLVTERTWTSVLLGLSAAAVLICAVAFAGRLLPDLFGVQPVAQTGNARRLSFPLGYWNALGAWASMTALLGLAVSSHVRPRGLRSASLAMLPVVVAVAYLTYSRAAIGGFAIGLIVLLASSRNRWTLLAHVLAAAAGAAALIVVIRRHPELANATGNRGNTGVLITAGLAGAACAIAAWATSLGRVDGWRVPANASRAVLGISLVAITVAAAVFAPSLATEGWERFTDTTVTDADDPAARVTNLNSGQRYLQWRAAFQAFKDEPVHGVGAGTFEFEQNRRALSSEFVRDAHSLYVETLAELGLVGAALLGLLILAIVALLVVAFRTHSSAPERGMVAGVAAATTAFLVSAGIDWIWESTAVVVLLLALVTSVGMASAGRAPRRQVAYRIPIVVGAILMALLQLPGLVATSEIRKSREAVASGDIAAARAHADAAIDSEPWAASPLIQRALVDERDGALEAAVAELQVAAERERLNWRIPLLLARVHARNGDAEAALMALERAEDLRPLSRFFQAE